MILTRYKRRPEPPQVAWLDSDGAYLSEHGDTLTAGELDAGWRVYCSWETAAELTRQGKGEALCWRGEHIRWRPRQHDGETDWYPRPSDACVIRLPWPGNPDACLTALRRWRGWLADYGAAPGASVSGASRSLLRATLRRRLVLGWNDKPFRQSFTVGGRIGMSMDAGTYTGPLYHVDLPAAYASELGNLRCGGRWLQTGRLEWRRLEHARAAGLPIFARARVTIPRNVQPGPLVRRPVGKTNALVRMMGTQDYPVGCRIQRVWTIDELQAARDVGCRVDLLAAWINAAPTEPFADWWAAVQDGRSLGGMAGALAKLTGNSLWGVLAMEPDGGRRAVLTFDKRGRGRLRTLPPKPYQLSAWDVSETVAGRVRARLHRAMVASGAALMFVHTDGLWALSPIDLDGWREKERASRMQLLSPVAYRYWTRAGTRVVLAGVPFADAEETFERQWADRQEVVST